VPPGTYLVWAFQNRYVADLATTPVLTLGAGATITTNLNLIAATRTISGQVVDAAMVDGVALLTTLFHGLRAEGLWSDEPATNVLDLGAAHYNVYETSDGRYVTVGAGEPQFYRQLLQRLGLDGEIAGRQTDPAAWAEDRERLAAVFRTKTFAEWCALLDGTETCFAPVLTMGEATQHPHAVERRSFVEVDGVVQPAPAPRFSRTPAPDPGAPVMAGEQTVESLAGWGFERAELDSLLAAGVVRQAPPR
jgi:alpha-methylacyl-CoA racemase